MAARFPWAGRAVLIGAAAIAATAALARDGSGPDEGRLRLDCLGTMIAGEAPEGRVVAGGFVDFVAGRVTGFGLGSTPIVAVSDVAVAFGSPLVAGAAGPAVEGAIDRRTGAARVVVRSSADAGRRLIAMDLACRMSPVGS
jgi:hypothetical protein